MKYITLFLFCFISIQGYGQSIKARQSSIITVDSVAEILSMKLRLGDRIKVKSTGAEYLVQADSVAGYEVDQVAVVENGGNYAVLQPVGDTYLYSQFRVLGTDAGVTINKAFEYMKAVRNLSQNVNNFNNVLDSNYLVINKLLLDQKATSLSRIVIPDGMTLQGGNNSIYTDNNAGAPVLFFDLNNASDTAIVFEDRFENLNGTQYRRGEVKNMVISFKSECNIGIWYAAPMGEVLNNVYIEGNDFVNVGIKTGQTIFTEFNRLRVENCDTSLYLSDYGSSTSFTSSFSTYTRGKVGIYIDPYANSSEIKFNRCYVENSDSVYIVIGQGNRASFNGLETEGNGVAFPNSLFKIGQETTNNANGKKGYVSIYDSRLEASVINFFDIDTLEQLNLVNCIMNRNFTTPYEFKGTDQFNSVNIIGGRSTNTVLGTGPTRGLIDSLDSSTFVNIQNFNKENGGTPSYIFFVRGENELTSFDELNVLSDQRILIDVNGNGGKIKGSTLFPDNPYPVDIGLGNNNGPGYSGVYNGLVQQLSLDSRIDIFKSTYRALNLTETFASDVNNYESALDMRNGSNGLSGDISGYNVDFILGAGTNTGVLSDLAGYRISQNTLRGTRNITSMAGIKIENFLIKDPTVSITNAYGILIDNLSQDATNTYAIKTGTGLVEFGDSLSVAGNISSPTITVLQYNYTFTPFAYNAVDTIPVDTLLSQRFVVTGALDSKTITGIEYTLDSQVTTRSTLVRLLKYTPSTDTYVAFGSASLTVGNNFVTNTPSQTITQGDIIYAEVTQAGGNASGLTVSLKIE